MAHDISAYSLVALTRATLPLMQGRNGALVTLNYACTAPPGRRRRSA